MEKEFKHNCDTNKGSSGSPIILTSNLNVIGIHTGGIVEEEMNLGTFIGAVMDDKNPGILGTIVNEPYKKVNYKNSQKMMKLMV